MSADAPPRTTVPSMGCGYLVCALLVLAGIGVIAAVRAKDTPARRVETWLGLTFGAMMCVGGVALIGPMQREVARTKDRLRREQEKPGEPWTWDPAWTNARGIVQARRRHARAMQAFGILALAMTVPVAVAVLPRELARGNYAALLLLAFPLAGSGMLVAVVVDRMRRRKYGTAHFVPAATPFALGGEVTGMVVVDRPVLPAGTGRMTLDCWSVTIARAGGKRRQREQVVSHTEREIARDDWKSMGRDTQLFVQLPVRGGRASTMHHATVNHPAFEWRLRIEVPTAGPDFVAEFAVPVFALEGTAAATAGEVVSRGAPPVDREAVWRAAGIVEDMQPGAAGGRALLFPAAVGRSFIVAPLLMALVPAGVAVAIWVAGGPGFVAALLGLFAALPALVLPSLWNGGGERVWVEGGAICVRRGRGTLRRVERDGVREIAMSKSIGVGAQQFYRIEARAAPPAGRKFAKRVPLVSMVRGDEAAGQAVAWIEERITQAG